MPDAAGGTAGCEVVSSRGFVGSNGVGFGTLFWVEGGTNPVIKTDFLSSFAIAVWRLVEVMLWSVVSLRLKLSCVLLFVGYWHYTEARIRDYVGELSQLRRASAKGRR